MKFVNTVEYLNTVEYGWILEVIGYRLSEYSLAKNSLQFFFFFFYSSSSTSSSSVSLQIERIRGSANHRIPEWIPDTVNPLLGCANDGFTKYKNVNNEKFLNSTKMIKELLVIHILIK